MAKKKKSFPIRYLMQIIFFIFISYIAINHLVIRGGPDVSATIHAYCPFGAIESLYNNLVHGTFVYKVQYSSYVLFVAIVGISLLFGKGFCGWVCPFGSLQEWIRIGGAKLFKRKKSLLPQVVDAKMRYLKYGVVLLIVIPSFVTGRMVFENYDPFVAFFHFGEKITGELQPAYIILGVVLVFSLFIGRFWCRYFCPLGAILGLLNKISLFSIKRVKESCTDCGLCDTKCPVDIQLSNIDRLKSAECIGCLESEQACPQKGALFATTLRLKHSLGSYSAMLLVSLFLVIGLARLTSYWQTTGSVGPGGRPPEAQRGRYQRAIPQEGERQRESGVELREGVVIRGSMTLREVAKKAELTHEELCRRLRIPASTSKRSTLKDIILEYGYSMTQIVDMLRSEEVTPQEEEPKREGGIELREGVVIRASMNLEEVAKIAELTHEELCHRLRIPASTSKALILKDIMQEYGYPMSRVVEMLRSEEVPPQEEEPEREGGIELREGVVIRGSMSLEEVAKIAELPHEELCRRLRIPASTSKKLILKDMIQQYRYSMSQIVEMLRSEELPRMPGYRQEQRPPGRGVGQRPGRGGGIVIKSGVILRGNMTLGEVANALRLSHQELCRRLKIPSSTPRDLILKDIMIRYGYSMSQIAMMLEEG